MDWSLSEITTKNIIKNIDEDVMNPEVKMSREDYQDTKYWDYWYIHSISSLSAQIQFPFSKNNSTHIAQVLKGATETYIEVKLVTSE